MSARFFSRIKSIYQTKKTILRIPKTLLFVSILFFAFSTPASANIDHFKTLFDSVYSPPVGPAAFVLGKIDDAGHVYKNPPEKTNVKDLIFKFTGRFDTDNTSLSIYKTWFWDHIANFEVNWIGTERHHVFVVRVCPATTDGSQPDDANCIFADAPYASECPGTWDQCNKTLGDTGVFSYAIFHRSHGTGFNNDTALAQFGVNMKNLSFYKLDKDGTYGDAANIDLTPGSTYTADLWYCAGNPSSDGDKNDVPPTKDEIDTMQDSGIKNFNYLCGSNHPAYFRIGETLTMPTVPQTVDQQPTNGADLANATNSGSENGDNLPTCDMLNGWRPIGSAHGTFLGCVAQFFYYAVYSPIQWFAGIMGKIFDFFIGYSLDDQSYRADFVVTAWKVIRDISNIFFIIILIWTGLAAVFDIGKTSMKHVVPTLIINALLINFSLFVTRVAVDLSNVVARVFYNSIHVQKEAGGESLDRSGAGGYKPLSVKLVSLFDPQQLFKPENVSVSALPSAAKTDINGNEVMQETLTNNRESTAYASYYIIVSFIAAVIVFAIASMFWKTAFFFLGRVIGLYIVMIFSPFAFLTRDNIPLVGDLPHLSMKNWGSELLKYSLLAPLFVFFLYIIYMLANSPFLGSVRDTVMKGGGILNTVIAIAIPMLIIWYMIKQGVDLASKYAGQAGGIVQSYLNTAVSKVGGFAGGTAIGLATGGLGVVGRGVGAAAKQVRNNTSLGNWINRNQTKNSLAGWVARKSNATLQKTQTSSFDLRNSKLISGQVEKFGKEFGMKLQTNNSLVSALKLDSKRTEGGHKAYEERKAKEIKKDIDTVETHYKTDKEATAFYNDVLKREYQEEKKQIAALNASVQKDSALLEKMARKELDDKVKSEAKAGKTFKYTDADVQEATAKQKERLAKKTAMYASDDVSDEFRAQQQKEFGNVKDNKTLTQAMRLRYAKDLMSGPATSWDVLRSIINPAMAPDVAVSDNAKKEALGKYMKDTQKSFKTAEKAAKELETIDETLTNILKEMHTQDNTTYDKFRNSRGDLDSKEMDDNERNEMLKKRRENLETQLDVHEQKMDELKQKMRNPRSTQIDVVQKAYDTAVARGDQAEASNAEAELNRLKKEMKDALTPQYEVAAKERNSKKEEIDDLKNILRRRSQAEQKVDGKKEGKKDEGKGDKDGGDKEAKK